MNKKFFNKAFSWAIVTALFVQVLPFGLVGEVRAASIYDGNYSMVEEDTCVYADILGEDISVQLNIYKDCIFEVLNGNENVDNVSLSFNPNQLLSRASFARILAMNLLRGQEFTAPTSSVFFDVNFNSETTWFAPYVQYLYQAGLVEGNLVNGQRFFYPEQNVTNIEALKVLLQAYFEGEVSYATGDN